jgi:hypothetical protein
VPRGEKPPVAGGKLGLPDTVAQGISRRSFLGALKNKIKMKKYDACSPSLFLSLQ